MALPTLRRMIKTLKEKLDIILTLDAEILDAAKEDEIKEEIEQADLYQVKVGLAIITLQMGISDLEQGALASMNGNTREQSSSGGTQASATNNAIVTMAQEPQRDGKNRVATQVDRSATTSAAETGPEHSRIHKVKLPKMVLKKFDGQLTNWATFWDMFKSSVHTNTELSDIDRFNYLQSLLEGPVADAVAGLSLTTVNYTKAISILKKRFGNKQQVVSKHMILAGGAVLAIAFARSRAAISSSMISMILSRFQHSVPTRLLTMMHSSCGNFFIRIGNNKLLYDSGDFRLLTVGSVVPVTRAVKDGSRCMHREPKRGNKKPWVLQF